MDTRLKLVRCASRELERKGLKDFSLRAVGAKAGLSAMAVYRHFSSKEELLRAVGEDAFAEFQQRIEAIPEGPIEKWLRAVARAYLTFALDEPGAFEGCFVLKTKAERIYPEDFRAGKSPVITRIVQRLQAAQSAALVGAGDAVELALLLWSQLHGLIMLHQAGRFSLSRRAFLTLGDRAVEHFIAGLRVR